MKKLSKSQELLQLIREAEAEEDKKYKLTFSGKTKYADNLDQVADMIDTLSNSTEVEVFDGDKKIAYGPKNTAHAVVMKLQK